MAITKRELTIAVLALATMLVSGCGHHGKLVTQQDMGDEWPFTVDRGYVYCIDGAPVFEADGTVYGLNGIGLGRGYADPHPIWRDNPELYGSKVSIGPIQELARRQGD